MVDNLEPSAPTVMISMLSFAHIIGFFASTCHGATVITSITGETTGSDDVVVIGYPDANNTIVIGYMMDQVGPPYRLGALSMSIENNLAGGLLTNYNFRLCYKKTHRGLSIGLNSAN